MTYLLLGAEGILTFLSPCILPLLPIYLSYFGGSHEEDGQSLSKTLLNATLFVLGFSLVFVISSLFISSLGRYFIQYRRWIHIISGSLLIILGIDFLRSNALLTCLSTRQQTGSQNQGSNSFMLGLMFAINWTPCVGTFLGAVMAQVMLSDSLLQSALMLLVYCLGLGIPFILTALLMDELQSTLTWFKNHQSLVQKISGGLLIVLGLVTMFGWLEALIYQLV